MVRSGGGVFEVEMDGRTIYSKKHKGRFPDEQQEIYPQIEALIGD